MLTDSGREDRMEGRFIEWSILGGNVTSLLKSRICAPCPCCYCNSELAALYGHFHEGAMVEPKGYVLPNPFQDLQAVFLA